MRGTVCSIVGFFASFGANSTISHCAETSIVKILDFFLENHQTFHFFIVLVKKYTEDNVFSKQDMSTASSGNRQLWPISTVFSLIFCLL